MELLVLAGLISGGYFININAKNNNIDIDDVDEDDPKNSAHVGNDLYDSTDYLLNRKTEFAKADAVFKQSLDFPKSGITPFYSNTLGKMYIQPYWKLLKSMKSIRLMEF